jgi:hypothetical protein
MPNYKAKQFPRAELSVGNVNGRIADLHNFLEQNYPSAMSMGGLRICIKKTPEGV